MPIETHSASDYLELGFKSLGGCSNCAKGNVKFSKGEWYLNYGKFGNRAKELHQDAGGGRTRYVCSLPAIKTDFISKLKSFGII